VYIGFFSDLPPGPCSDIGCFTTEDGTVQTLPFIPWSEGTVDTFLFQSDAGSEVGDTPEPGTLLILVTGILGIRVSEKATNGASEGNLTI
jgi:hypothetical protein